MKKIVLLFSLVLFVVQIHAQTPESINYQAVARDVNGSILSNRLLGFQISVLQGSPTGNAVYVERHSINSNAFGLVNFRIGEGSIQSGTFSAINWAAGPYYIQIELDPQGGSAFQLMSTSPLVSVPYALHAKSADNVADAIQVLSKNGNIVSLNPNGGSFVDEVNDADSDPNNEIQTLSKNGNQIFLSLNGGSVIDEVDDADNDPTNELQILSFSNDTLYISNGNDVFLGSLSTVNTDSQNLSFSNDTLYIDNGNLVFLGGYTAAINAVNAARTTDSTSFANGLISAEAARVADSTLFATHVANDFDNDSTNELQLLSLSNDTLYLSNGNEVFLGGLSSVNTDSQNLSFSNDTLYIDNGNFVFLGGYTAAINAVNAARATDSTSFANGLISAEAARVADSTLFAAHVTNDFDNDSTNELQLLSLSNDTLYLSNGNEVFLGGLSSVNTDSQNLSFSNDTLYIDNGNFVFLGGYTAAINAVNAARATDSTSFANGLISAEAARVADSTLFAAHVTNDFDNDSTNELQALSISNDSILLSKSGGGVSIAGLGSRWNENAGNIQRSSGRVAIGTPATNFGRFQITDTLGARIRSFRHDVATPSVAGSFIGYDLNLTGSEGTKRGLQVIVSGANGLNQAGYFLSNGNSENTSILGISGAGGPFSASANFGVYGQAQNSSSENIGVQGRAMSSNGTFVNYGTSGTVSGNANNTFNIGAYGEAVGAGSGENYGVISYAFSSTTANYAIYSEAPSNAFSYSGYFVGNVVIDGNVDITGNISKGSGTFKIDHPADPSNKYLVHSFVESPEMMNVYNGNITTDANGFATVELPDYFEMANKDFRYQLTVIGTFAQAIVKDKVKNNRFVIQTNQPNVEVSWQVTGIRNDNYSNANRIIPVQNKDERARGKYLHPEVYGQPKEMGERHKDMKVKPGQNTGPNVQTEQSEK